MAIRRLAEKLVWSAMLWVALPLSAQVNTGQLRLTVKDQAGMTISFAPVVVESGANHYQTSLTTNATGKMDVKTLPYGIYVVRAEKTGFDATTETVEVRSSLPVEHTLVLKVAALSTSVVVSAMAPLIDPYRPSSVMQIGSQQIEDRVGSLPGRSVQDLVNSQPGWLYEGNAVLHPRGSEYQTQFVIDGIPLTDNRSPGLGPEIEADDLESASVYTAGIPAEYGRKMGGVVELNTRHEGAEGLHGAATVSGGSYDTASGSVQAQNVWRKNTLGASASGSTSAHYLNPVVPENFTNRGTTGDFSLNYERDLAQADRLSFTVRHELSRFEIPNELVQQQVGQLQTGDTIETMGTVRYRHIFSPNSLGTIAGMVRDNADDLNSNQNSTPIIATHHNDFREGYVKAAYTLHHGRQEFKAGVESDTIFLHESFGFVITDPTQFDAGTPTTTAPFAATDVEIEPSAFAEDLIRLGKWTVSAGLRWDHHQLLTSQSAFSPRLSVGRYFPSLNLVAHGSLDRVFQPPSFENLVITSSQWIHQISPSVLHRPVKPSTGTYYEVGLSEGFKGRMAVDMNVYRRDLRNFADDDQLLNTSVSYPFAFDKAVIYGAEAKLTLVQLGKLSGFASYSYMVGNAWYPVSGGLFLGDNAVAALTQTTGHFPVSQDQRNTARTRFRYQIAKRAWLAVGANFGSGLPFAYSGDEPTALAQYGPALVSRIDFDRGRVRPSLAANASVGIDLYKADRRSVRFQADGDNLNGRLNVIDFGGLFSGNAIAPGRSFGLRLHGIF